MPVPFDWGYFPATEPTFPPELIEAFVREAGLPGILGNKHASGTTIIAELGEALNVHGGAPPANAPQHWRGLFARRHRDDGPTGDVLLAAATPVFDNTAVVVYDMRSESHGFSIQARAVGDAAGDVNPFESGLPGVPLAWWARDDRDNTYLGQWGGHSGGDHDISGELGFHPPLDPRARQLVIMPTGLSQRAVIEVVLPDWSGGS